MLFGKTSLELKVGIFVFLGLFILVAFVLSIGGMKTWTAGYLVNFTFNFGNGIRVGAPVRFAGIDAGEVKRINFVFIPEEQRTMIEVVCWVRRNVMIPLDSAIWINTLGLLGEKYIEIMPGKDYEHCLAQGQSLVGIDPLAIHDLVRLSKDIADNIDQTMHQINTKEGTVGRLLYDDSIYKELEAMIKDLRQHPWKLFFRPKEKPEKKK